MRVTMRHNTFFKGHTLVNGSDCVSLFKDTESTLHEYLQMLIAGKDSIRAALLTLPRGPFVCPLSEEIQ